MAHRVVWSRHAVRDLEAIGDYIAADSPAFAGIVVKKILSQTKILIEFPLAGRKVPEFDHENLRELVVYSYRIIYRLEGDEIVIAAIIHGKRILQ
jgi:toxin ParE1/3/4